jgi:hypothetical protein
MKLTVSKSAPVPFLSPVGEQALARLVQETAGWFPVAAGGEHPSQEDEALRRVRETGSALRAGMAEYREYAASVAA